MSRRSPVRAAVETSVFVRGFRQLAAAVSQRTPSARDAAPWDGEFDVLADMLSRARIGRPIGSAMNGIATAWRHARAVAIVERGASSVAALGPVDRVRAAGVAILAATVTNLLLTPIDPRPVSAPRWSLWACALLVSVAVALWPHYAVAAWIDWRSRRRDAGADDHG